MGTDAVPQLLDLEFVGFFTDYAVLSLVGHKGSVIYQRCKYIGMIGLTTMSLKSVVIMKGINNIKQCYTIVHLISVILFLRNSLRILAL